MINYMALLGVQFQLVTVIGGNIRKARRMDMEHSSGLMDRDTRGNTSRVRNTGMEYTDGQMEQSIMDSGNRVSMMVTDIIRVTME